MASVKLIFGGQEQKVYQLDKPQVLVGRDPGCDIPIDNLGISRHHCALAARGNVYVVQDMGSSNGTYVNGRKVTEYFLNDADEIVIGKYVLRFSSDQSGAAPARATASDGIPDTGNTYVMEGKKIQEKLAQVRATQGNTLVEGLPGPGATAKDYARALDPGRDWGQMLADVSRLKNYVVALCVVVVMLLILVGILFAILVGRPH